MNVFYSASIEYTQENIRKLSEVVASCFHFWIRALIYTLCVFLLFAAFFFDVFSKKIATISIIAFACVIITNIKAPARHRADQNYRAIGSSPLHVEYEFWDSSFCVHATSEVSTIKYDDVFMIFKDTDYLYLFKDRRSAFMVDIKTISPDSCSFITFLHQNTPAKWHYKTFLLTLIERIKLYRDP